MSENLKVLWVFLIGSFMGLMTGAIIVTENGVTLNHARKQKTLCEETLPRNQVCEMKFVPKED